ncbi:MarR family winged helix-turn-helix transcriptional regulator [Blastococcus saxobsidens]|uniref:Transcriptional regulator, MarR family n=1 Tax=Blastococcus saxobsidens (strain DD2) TaxID=1146883 RepID=H6RQL8_BLASD|nr:MarR family transcriptional regulator [Blastococcus saxobsidens]CCG05386.1 Transcriptional regulator, MarR family [Blastococcus saxobsidens DD2]
MHHPRADRLAEVATLSEQLPRFMRLVQALKSQPSGPEVRDRAALVLLHPLVRQGPIRQGTLAELVHADPSTVSRHVAALVEQGLVRRVADESDGRANRLVVTDAGRAALDSLRAERTAHLEQVTANWDPVDLATLTTLFGRLLDDLAAGLPRSTDPSPTERTTHPAGEHR